MRILFAFTGGRGHVEPLIPLAEAARAARHTVAFGGRDSILPVVAALGFDAFTTEPPAKPPQRLPLQPVDLEKEQRDFLHGFVGRAGERATYVRDLCAEWRPDVLVIEDTHLGAMVAAERVGVPWATLIVTAAATHSTAKLVAETLDPIRIEHGLEPDPQLSMPGRHLVLAPLPPSFRDPAFPLPATTTYFRPFAEPPQPYAGPPRVYFTLGTVFNLESGDLFSRVLAGLAAVDADVVATVGAELDPAELGPLPPRIRVERFLPQAEILGRCTAVVSHGGSGSVLGALAHGLPQVLIPMGADQPLNGTRAEALGVARVLDPVAATAEDVRAAVTAVLEEPSYREAAEALRAEFAALPGPAQAVELLERLP